MNAPQGGVEGARPLRRAGRWRAGRCDAARAHRISSPRATPRFCPRVMKVLDKRRRLVGRGGRGRDLRGSSPHVDDGPCRTTDGRKLQDLPSHAAVQVPRLPALDEGHGHLSRPRSSSARRAAAAPWRPRASSHQAGAVALRTRARARCRHNEHWVNRWRRHGPQGRHHVRHGGIRHQAGDKSGNALRRGGGQDADAQVVYELLVGQLLQELFPPGTARARPAARSQR